MRPGDRQRRPSWIFLGLVALLVASGAATWSGVGNVRIDAFLLVASGWLVSLCLHEFGHAFLAYRFGDDGVVERGYLTLNPLKYSNVLLSFVLPLVFVLLGGFGMPGGAVWVDRARIGGRARHSLVSAAGPAFNVVFALISAAPFFLGVADSTHLEFWAALAFLGFLQVTASVLNLVPMPGLDGYGILEPWLPPHWRRGAAMIAPYGMLLVFALLWEPRVNALFFRLVFFLADLIGIPLGAVAMGDQLFRFWT
ncbi:site-2 protease family protein [Actinocatenispora sera]|uniref:Site-2 protease family protein n=1 Tax=Actinocatenispora sera TaxID=390989 RepID=A0A810L967_9ACTN|nr:site-2 protease family protein [Actinocatenispora sera]BCJ31425.1 site-2 protease family protein [Actinocatenispora sera]